MTRKTLPGAKVPNHVHAMRLGSIAAETARRATIINRTDYHNTKSSSKELTDSSLNLAVEHSSPNSLCSSSGFPDQSTSPLGHVLTPTSSQFEAEFPSERYPDENSHSDNRWPTRSGISVNRSYSAINMPPDFDINGCPPFLDPMVNLGIQPYGVIKIKNVPFAVTIAEIKSFVSRLTTSPLIKDHVQGYPVHIIMERPTGKTMDCFVEFQHHAGAAAAVARAEKIQFEGRPLKIAQRFIDVEASNEGELCAALFPRAKSVKWNPETGVPTVLDNDDPFSEGFQGFITIEEITSICKHAANPQKSTFSQRCQQRVYESMISTLYKFPWHVPKHYSVNTRNFLWSAYLDMLRSLVIRVRPNQDGSVHNSPSREVGLSQNLLLEFVFAGLNVQMFSLRQKMLIVHETKDLAPGFPIPRQSPGWPFQALTVPPKFSADVVDQWLNILDIGFEKVVSEHPSHKYEDYFNLNRDDFGFMKFELSNIGKALPFHNLISFEKGLVEILLEQGRYAWCEATYVPYQPLDMWKTPRDEADRESIEAMQQLQISTMIDQDADDSSCADSTGLGFLIPNSPIEEGVSDGRDVEALQLSSDRALDHATYLDATGGSKFDPKSSPFIPAHSWISGSPSGAQNTLQSVNTPVRGGTTRHKLTAVLPPSRPPVSSLDSDLNVAKLRPSFSAQKQYHGMQESVQSHNVFTTHESYHGIRRLSLQSDHRFGSVASSPAKTSTPIRSNSVGGGELPGFNGGRQVSSSGLPLHAYPNTIWSPLGSGTPPASSNAVGTVSSRGSSAGSADGMKTPDHKVRSTSGTPTHTPIHISKSSSNYFPASYSSQPVTSASPVSHKVTRKPVGDCADHGWAACGDPMAHGFAPKLPTTEDGRPWALGRHRGTASRTSSARNIVRIHATIDEEGDSSAAETADDNEDTGNDAGGVSLTADN